MSKTPHSVPAWVDRMSGTLLICGSAPCVYDDLERAQELRPGATVLLINGATQLIEEAQHVLAGHGDKADAFMAARAAKFPNAPRVYVHASRRIGRPIGNAVTHVWENVSTGGTSAWKAVRIGRAMGYEELILCGCPLDNSGYAAGESDGIRHDCARIGLGDSRMYDNYRNSFAKRAKGEGQGVFSMSGYSRELLGAPC